MGSGALSDVLNKETRYLSMEALNAGPELSEGSLVTMLKNCFVVAAADATDADIIGTHCKYYDLQKRTEFTMLYYKNTLPDLSIFTVAGRMYRTNATISLVDSVTKDLGQTGVSGIEAFGRVHLNHYGSSYPVELKDGDRLEGDGMKKNLVPISTDTTVITVLGEGDGATLRYDHAEIGQMGFLLTGVRTLPVFDINDGAFGHIHDVYMDSETQQAPGVFAISLGDGSADQAYTWVVERVKIRGWTDAIKLKFAGSGAYLFDVSTYPVDGLPNSYATLIANSPNTHISGMGQGFIWFIQEGNGEMEGGSLDERFFEVIEVGEIAVRISGDTVLGNTSSHCTHIEIKKNVRFNGAVVEAGGTCIQLDRSRKSTHRAYCYNADQFVAGAYFYHLTQFAQEQFLEMDQHSAEAPIKVDAGAVRCEKHVLGAMSYGNATTLVTTSPNIITRILGGIVNELEGREFMHNGVNWNAERLNNLSDDTVTQLNLPGLRGKITVMHDKETDDDGEVSFYIGSQPSAEALDAGSNFEVIVAAGIGVPSEAVAIQNKTTLYINEVGAWLIHKNGNGDDLWVIYDDVSDV
jgi:hypothetical protein